MNRFNFFKTLIGTTLFSTLSNVNPIVEILPAKRTLKSGWSVEMEQDLAIFHLISIQNEIDDEFIRSIEHHI